MLDYNILKKKPILETNKGEAYIDLAQKTYSDKKYVPGEVLIINKYYVARPDLVSLAVYGDDQYADIICKINGISNPFELNENDIIFIPAIDTINSLTTINNKPSDLVDEEPNLYTKKTDIRKKSSDKRSPNEMTLSDSNYIIDHSLGLIFY